MNQASGKFVKSKKESDWLVGATLSIIAFILYFFTTAPTVLEADGGEFQFVPWLPGIAHPTGYPLYTLLGWLWTHVFFISEVAWRMNLLSAVFAALAVGVLYAVARQLLAQTLPHTPYQTQMMAAVLSAASFAVTYTFWSQAIIAEVYTLHAFFVAVILWLTLRLSTNFNLQAWPAKALTLTFGLGLTHHSTIILLLPAVGLFLFLAYKQSPREKSQPPGYWRNVALTHLVLFLTPLLLYLYFPLIAPATPYATLSLSDHQTLTLYDNTLSGFWSHINASAFAGQVQPAAVGVERFQLVWQLLRQQQLGWIGLGLAVIGIITLIQQKKYNLLLLTGLSCLTFTLFNLVYFIGDVFVLFIPVWLLVCLWLGLGSLSLTHWLAGAVVQRKTNSSNSQTAFGNMEQQLGQNIYRVIMMILLSIILITIVAPMTARNIEVNQRNNTAARQRWQQILAENILPEAVLISNDRNEIMPMWYYQYVDNRRPDLLGLFPLITNDPAYSNIGRVLDQALASQRPVYLIKSMDELGLKADLIPTGTLYRAEAISLTPDHLLNITLPEITTPENKTETINLWGYSLSTNTAKPGDTITVTLYWQPSQTLSVDYTSYVHLIDDQGQGMTQSDHRPGGPYYPSSYWQPNEILRDTHHLVLPTTSPAGEIKLRVGMYYQPEPGVIQSMGNGEEIGFISVASE